MTYENPTEENVIPQATVHYTCVDPILTWGDLKPKWQFMKLNCFFFLLLLLIMVNIATSDNFEVHLDWSLELKQEIQQDVKIHVHSYKKK